MLKIYDYGMLRPCNDKTNHAIIEPAIDPRMYQRAIVESFRKLNPRWMVRNPVMFVVEVGQRVDHCACGSRPCSDRAKRPQDLSVPLRSGCGSPCLFANFSEAMAEGRGKAQAESLRKARQDTPAKKLAAQRNDVQPAS